MAAADRAPEAAGDTGATDGTGAAARANVVQSNAPSTTSSEKDEFGAFLMAEKTVCAVTYFKDHPDAFCELPIIALQRSVISRLVALLLFAVMACAATPMISASDVANIFFFALQLRPAATPSHNHANEGLNWTVATTSASEEQLRT